MDHSSNKFLSFFPHEFRPFDKIVYLGSNYFVSVFDVNDTFIFRFANNRDGKESIKKLNCILGNLGKQISNVEIPETVFYKEFNNFPFCLIIFRKITGKELLPKFITESNMDSITKQLTDFMYQLHSLDNHKFISCAIPQYIPDSQVLNIIEAKTKECLLNYFDKNEMQIIGEIWHEVKKQTKVDISSYCLIHGDLWFENILFDPVENTITAVLDFENVSLGHPIIDFVSLRYYGETFLNNVVKN